MIISDKGQYVVDRLADMSSTILRVNQEDIYLQFTDENEINASMTKVDERTVMDEIYLKQEMPNG